jgi:hypothetical protein
LIAVSLSREFSGTLVTGGVDVDVGAGLGLEVGAGIGVAVGAGLGVAVGVGLGGISVATGTA